MRKIAAYHPIVEVNKRALIEVDLDDWYPDDEVVQILKEGTDAGSPEDVMEAVKSGDVKKGNKLLGARILESGEATIQIDD